MNINVIEKMYSYNITQTSGFLEIIAISYFRGKYLK